MAGIFMFIFLAIFLIILGRFIYIQTSKTVHGISLEEWAKEKRNSTYYLNAERGKIFDQNGMTLAYDRASFRMYAIVDETYVSSANEPLYVTDPKDVAHKLAPLLGADENYIFERIQNGKDQGLFQVEFGNYGKNLTQNEKNDIEQLNLRGIQFEQEAIRHYPNGIFASHILGFARKEALDDHNEEIIGITGIEKEMNDYLKGEDGYISFQRDRFNRKLLNPEEVIKKPENGYDIFLTIDQKIQTLLEDVMNEVEDNYNPEKITAVLVHAKSGEVLAMSNRPSYNPNNPVDVKNWYNDVISTPFEPGSTMKMFTWAAAIDAGVYDGNEKFKSGTYQINPRIEPINDHRREGWGSITFDEGFARSSNVAAAKLVWEKIGPDQYFEYLQAFDFDKKTEIDLPGEIHGKILYNWPLEKLTTGFGQGSTLTPIQQVKAATAIANGGKMMKPYVIQKIVDPNTNEIIEEKEPMIIGEPISEQTADEMLHLLDLVVNSKNGTGKKYQLENYTVIGKTGTAEIPDPDGMGYLRGNNQYIYSFLGMAPKDDPELIMYVSVTQPKLSTHETGTDPVSYIFKNVMENGLHYLNISPDKEDLNPIQTIELPDYENRKPKDFAKELSKKGLRVTIVGDGENVVQSSVKTGEEILTNDHLILITDQPKMPNIIGWSLRDVTKLADLLDLHVEYIGNGYVILQSIEEGSPLHPRDYLGIELSPPSSTE